MSKNGNNNGERLKKKLGVRLRELRKLKKLSQAELSYECNLDRTYIASIEQGKRNVSLINLRKLSNAFGMSISKFLEPLNGNNHNDNLKYL